MPITYLKDNNYLPDLINEINNAKMEVVAVIYLCKYVRKRKFDHAKLVINSLVRKHKEGVTVKAIFQVGQHKRRIPGWNLLVYRDLKAAGLNVKIWKERRILHAKFIVVDRKITFIGSHNISNCSLRESAEVSVRIEGKEEGQKAAVIFNEFWKQGV